MKLIVTRHGETNYNAASLYNHDPSVDVHLTENGIRQAEQLAEDLRDTPIDLVITSRLKRTKQTAEIINRFHQAPVVEDGRLDDTYNGFEGQKVSTIKAARNQQSPGEAFSDY